LDQRFPSGVEAAGAGLRTPRDDASKKVVTPAGVTIARSSQAGARISPKGAQRLQPETATHEPPPCASKPADHRPLPRQLCTTRTSTQMLHRATTGTSRAAGRSGAPKPSPPASLNRRPHGQFRPTSSPSEAAAPAPGSHGGQKTVEPPPSREHGQGEPVPPRPPLLPTARARRTG
jgi:hypothetical protein